MKPTIKTITITYEDRSTLELTYDQFQSEFSRWLEELYDRSESGTLQTFRKAEGVAS